LIKKDKIGKKSPIDRAGAGPTYFPKRSHSPCRAHTPIFNYRQLEHGRFNSKFQTALTSGPFTRFSEWTGGTGLCTFQNSNVSGLPRSHDKRILKKTKQYDALNHAVQSPDSFRLFWCSPITYWLFQSFIPSLSRNNIINMK
jgi:hypothetical protein